MQVSKWGNSLAVRLPKRLVDAMGLREGDDLTIEALGKATIGIRPTARQQRFLDDLRSLQKPTPDGLSWTRDDATRR